MANKTGYQLNDIEVSASTVLEPFYFETANTEELKKFKVDGEPVFAKMFQGEPRGTNNFIDLTTVSLPNNSTHGYKVRGSIVKGVKQGTMPKARNPLNNTSSLIWGTKGHEVYHITQVKDSEDKWQLEIYRVENEGWSKIMVDVNSKFTAQGLHEAPLKIGIALVGAGGGGGGLIYYDPDKNGKESDNILCPGTGGGGGGIALAVLDFTWVRNFNSDREHCPDPANQYKNAGYRVVLGTGGGAGTNWSGNKIRHNGCLKGENVTTSQRGRPLTTPNAWDTGATKIYGYAALWTTDNWHLTNCLLSALGGYGGKPGTNNITQSGVSGGTVYISNEKDENNKKEVDNYGIHYINGYTGCSSSSLNADNPENSICPAYNINLYFTNTAEANVYEKIEYSARISTMASRNSLVHTIFGGWSLGTFGGLSDVGVGGNAGETPTPGNDGGFFLFY